MQVEIITKTDLIVFKRSLLKDIEAIFNAQPKPTKWLKSAQVRKLMNISAGTLQTMRNNGTIPFHKVGGAIFYSQPEIEKIMHGKKVTVKLNK